MKLLDFIGIRARQGYRITFQKSYDFRLIEVIVQRPGGTQVFLQIPYVLFENELYGALPNELNTAVLPEHRL